MTEGREGDRKEGKRWSKGYRWGREKKMSSMDEEEGEIDTYLYIHTISIYSS